LVSSSEPYSSRNAAEASAELNPVILPEVMPDGRPEITMVPDIGDVVVLPDADPPAVVAPATSIVAGELEISTSWTSAVARVCKRAMDVVGASILLLLTLPLLIVGAVATLTESSGPILFRHTRIGRNGREFRLLKFRTMVADGEEILRRHLHDNAEAAAEWAANHKLTVDPRVTRTGSILRRFSLDELPQLLNVLRGDMSLVGPRPVTRDELPRFGDVTPVVLSVRPGLTGLWAVSGRSHISYTERVELEYRYVREWRLWRDAAILLQTIPAVLSGRGAH
jgi:exopolysaccharide production protein ExoY